MPDGYPTIQATIGNARAGNIVYRNNLIDNSLNAFVDHTPIPSILVMSSVLSEMAQILLHGTTAKRQLLERLSVGCPHAAEIDASGIGNIFYVIDTDNVDHYPLMQ